MYQGWERTNVNHGIMESLWGRIQAGGQQIFGLQMLGMS